MSPISISLFFPCYNEQDNVKRVVEKAVEVLEGMGADFEVIVVNDGSADGTGEEADALAAADKRVRVVHHPQNMGYGAAVQSGIRNAKKELIFFTDGDGQFDIGEIKLLLPFIEQTISCAVIGLTEKTRLAGNSTAGCGLNLCVYCSE
jgi:glycosyltransferase involved in cell wall biosynthesis